MCGLMRPITTCLDDTLNNMRSGLDPRVFVALGRAMWDYVGKDLYEFVMDLQVGGRGERGGQQVVMCTGVSALCVCVSALCVCRTAMTCTGVAALLRCVCRRAMTCTGVPAFLRRVCAGQP